MIFQDMPNISSQICSEIRALWNKEYPKVIQENSQEKFQAYIDKLEDARHVLVLDKRNRVQGWYADFNRENDRWFVLILSAKTQGKGFGRKLIERAQKRHKRLNGWAIFANNYQKADGSFYHSPIGFYEKLGFQIRWDIVFETAIMKTLKIEWRQRKI